MQERTIVGVGAALLVGVTCCRFDVTSESGAPVSRIVVVRRGDDGREHATEVGLDADGRGLAWLQGEVGVLRIAADGHRSPTVAAWAQPAADCKHFRAVLAVR